MPLFQQVLKEKTLPLEIQILLSVDLLTLQQGQGRRVNWWLGPSSGVEEWEVSVSGDKGDWPNGAFPHSGVGAGCSLAPDNFQCFPGLQQISSHCDFSHFSSPLKVVRGLLPAPPRCLPEVGSHMGWGQPPLPVSILPSTSRIHHSLLPTTNVQSPRQIGSFS